MHRHQASKLELAVTKSVGFWNSFYSFGSAVSGKMAPLLNLEQEAFPNDYLNSLNPIPHNLESES